MSDSASSPKPGIELNKLILQNNDGENLVGLLHETGSPELVILCHGLTASKEANTMVTLADAIAKQGISVFRFDFSGNGESGGSFQFGDYQKEVEDLRSVVLYFSEGKRTVTTVVGHSKGGNVVLLYASRYNNVPTIVNVSGRCHMEEGLEFLGKDFLEKIKENGFIDFKNKKGQYRVTEESLMERLGTDMKAACLSIDKNCRVMTVHGSSDEVIPVEDAYEFSKIIPNHKLHIINGADHVYTKHQAELAEVVTNFISSFLQRGKI